MKKLISKNNQVDFIIKAGNDFVKSKLVEHYEDIVIDDEDQR